jgi:hypothetical protein
MNMENLKTISQCLTADLTQDRVALHETGHVITMYALGMMDHFAYVTKKAGDGTLGLTEVTDDFKADMQKFAGEITTAASNLHLGKDFTRIVQLSRLEAARNYLPNICRLFGGGAICRYYNLPDEAMCSIDYSLIDTLLSGLGMVDKRETLLPLVDMYMNTIFVSLDLLTKAIYVNLVEQGTLKKDQVMQIIKDWEEYKLI